jgi:predicted ATPase/DNA-binding SARP family transcriptional activator
MSGPDLSLLDGVSWQGRDVPRGRGGDLLAALTLAAPRSVAVSELVRDVWAEDEPAHPEKALQVLVSRVRSQTSADTVSRVGTGYRLGLRPDQVDLLRLRRLVDDGTAARSAGDLDVARLQAREALAWPLTTAAEDGPLADAVSAAREEQARARRLLGVVLLARGDAGEALPLLESTLADSPGDEALLADVLRAEAQVRGVPAALARFAAYTEAIRDQLGASPGQELGRLHAELLAREAPVRQGLKYDGTPLVGRDDDVVRIRGLLERSRVVSIVGAGGLGKTRMANLVGRLAAQPVVHFVELAGVTAADGVLPEVAGALGVRESVTSVRTAQLRADMRGRVAEKLSGPPTLLILDNCEHLVDSVADLVAFLVASTDATSVLTTSRAPLGIASEQVYLLPQLGSTAAVELFDQRARAARPGVRLDEEQVTALVERLDGLPLAIELAAAKVRVMGVSEISRRLGDRFALLSGRDRSAPDRHQTLEAVIEWSWNLLGEDDRQALCTWAMFPDGFSIDGAEALLGRDPLASLTELVDQSMLVVREGDGVRYRFLETVREYGLKQLDAAGATETVRARLLDWAVDLSRELVGRLFSPEQIETMPAIRAEAGNLAGVMRSALDDDSANIVPLVGVLISFWTIEGDHLGVLQVAREVIDRVAVAPQPDKAHEAELRGVLVALIITTTLFTGDPPSVATARLESLGLAGDHSRTDALTRLLLEVYAEGGPSLEVLDRLCEDDDLRLSRVALQWATQARENAGDLAGALDAAQRGLETCDDLDGPWTRALFDAQVTGLLTQAGDWPGAVGHARRAIPVMQALGAFEDVMQLRGTIAFADIAAGRLDEAARVIEEIVADERRGSSVGWSVSGLTGEAELALARGETEAGLRLLLDCLDAVASRDVPGLAPSLLMPWLLFAEASALFAHVLHGRHEDVTWLAERIRGKLPDLLEGETIAVDYPVLGGVLLAEGCWVLAGAPSPEAVDAALRMVALGYRFGYHRELPSLAWSNVTGLVDGFAPGRLAPLVDRFSDVASVDLLGEAREALSHLTGPADRQSG